MPPEDETRTNALLLKEKENRLSNLYPTWGA